METLKNDSSIYCSPETKLVNAKKVMKEFNCDTLSIIDKDRVIHGTITHQDICNYLQTKNNHESIRIKELFH
jgi:predicted transcriptional regulator